MLGKIFPDGGWGYVTDVIVFVSTLSDSDICGMWFMQEKPSAALYVDLLTPRGVNV